METKKQIELIVACLFMTTIMLFATLIFLNHGSVSIKSSTNIVAIQTINYPSQIVKCNVIRTPYEVEYNLGTTNHRSQNNKAYESSQKSYTKNGFLIGKVDVYEVNIKNKGCKSDYFSVEFTFTESCGKVTKETVRNYAPKNKEKIFRYTNVNREKEISSWSYKVIAPNQGCNKESSYNTRKTGIKTRYLSSVECLKI